MNDELRRIVPALVVVLLAGCDRLDMYDQPRYEPLEASDFFSDWPLRAAAGRGDDSSRWTPRR